MGSFLSAIVYTMTDSVLPLAQTIPARRGAPRPMALALGPARAAKLARKRVIREQKLVFRVLRQMRDALYRSTERRKQSVSLCHDIDVQRLTIEANMKKQPVRARQLAYPLGQMSAVRA